MDAVKCMIRKHILTPLRRWDKELDRLDEAPLHAMIFIGALLSWIGGKTDGAELMLAGFVMIFVAVFLDIFAGLIEFLEEWCRDADGKT